MVPQSGPGSRDAVGARRPDRHRRFRDDPPSPWPPKRSRLGSGSSLRNLGDASGDRGYGDVGRFRFMLPVIAIPWPSRDRSVETPQTLYENFGRPRGRRGVSGAATSLRSSSSNPEGFLSGSRRWIAGPELMAPPPRRRRPAPADRRHPPPPSPPPAGLPGRAAGPAPAG